MEQQESGSAEGRGETHQDAALQAAHIDNVTKKVSSEITSDTPPHDPTTNGTGVAEEQQPSRDNHAEATDETPATNGDDSNLNGASDEDSESKELTGGKSNGVSAANAQENNSSRSAPASNDNSPDSSDEEEEEEEEDEDQGKGRVLDIRTGIKQLQDTLREIKSEMANLTRQKEQILDRPSYLNQPWPTLDGGDVSMNDESIGRLPPTRRLDQAQAAVAKRTHRLAQMNARSAAGLAAVAAIPGFSHAVVDQTGSQVEEKTASSGSNSACKDFRRVDQVWDSKIHQFKLQDTVQEVPDRTPTVKYFFQVRRTFDWDGKYKQTFVDIKSTHLRDCLKEVMGNIKGVSVVEDNPKVEANTLFLYLDELRELRKSLKNCKPAGEDKLACKAETKRILAKRKELKVLLKYLDTDFKGVKDTLQPMLDNGLITYDLLWALWKPNTLAYTHNNGSHHDPRIFRVEMAEKQVTILGGDFYYLEGKSLEYDGKHFGLGTYVDEIKLFKGAQKITSLGSYPLKYHSNEAQLRKDLIERGKKFVAMPGVNYKHYDGMAYYKKKKTVSKVHISGRIMIDPCCHRRINPNYPISRVQPSNQDGVSQTVVVEIDDSSVADEEDSDSDIAADQHACASSGQEDDGAAQVKLITTSVNGTGKNVTVLNMSNAADDKVSGEGDLELEANGENKKQAAGSATEEDKPAREFTEEEYLIASPTVLGFAFAEKMWLEFRISAVSEIPWNEQAWESLVLEPKTKDIVQSLVKSHKYHPAESIDDVIQGKGKGLIAVLHGPPGTGKTLTAEGIAELLKCPLYMVSAGELGTDSRRLESELQRILDICHAWGAILLLDEADVFLEKRNMHEIHRNALVSIFLRHLEYYQGILFLTTNRVETFDDAFQSRIHIALRYDKLDARAKRSIFKIFIERVRVLEHAETMPFTEQEYADLARHDLNGREIKNTVRTAQALAINKGEALAMKHIRQVLDVQIAFDRDIRGGPGYQDAMRSYY